MYKTKNRIEATADSMLNKAAMKMHLTDAPTVNAKSASNKTKTAIMIKMLSKAKGFSIDDLCKTTGWQAHSIHGFMAGTLKRKGYKVSREMRGATRFYKIIGQVEQL